MKWSSFYQQFQKMVLPKDQVKGVDFVYVISHEKSDSRYKIGITEQNLFSRLRAYQTPFVEFHVQYLIALPDKGARVLERELHNSKHLESKRMKFGKKHPDAKTSYSEWFKTDLGIIKYAIQRAFRYSDQHMLYFAYDLTGNALTRWDALEMYVSKPKTTTREIKTRSGRVHKRIETESKKNKTNIILHPGVLRSSNACLSETLPEITKSKLWNVPIIQKSKLWDVPNTKHPNFGI